MTAPEELAPIERDEEMDRTYIPLPGGWEVQTKGKGSSFRICDTKSGERDLVIDQHLHEMLTRMAHEIRAAWNRRVSAPQQVTEEMISRALWNFKSTEPPRVAMRAALTAALSRKETT